MKFRSCDGRRIADNTPISELFKEPEGTFCYGKMCMSTDMKVVEVWKTIDIVVPYGTDRPHGEYSIHSLRIYREGEPVPPKPKWMWDGNLDRPTLLPSILCRPDEPLWHGHMTDGRLVACE